MKIIRFFFLLFKKRMRSGKIDPYGMCVIIGQQSAKILKVLGNDYYIVIFLNSPYKVEKVQHKFMSEFVPLRRAHFKTDQVVMVINDYNTPIKDAKKGKIVGDVALREDNSVLYNVEIENSQVNVDQRKIFPIYQRKIFPYSIYLQNYINNDEYEGKENIRDQTLMSGDELYRLNNSNLLSTLNTFQLFYLNMFFRLFFQHKTFAPKIEKYTLFFIMTSNDNTSTVAENDTTGQAKTHGKTLSNDFLVSSRIYKLKKTTCKRLYKNIERFVFENNKLLIFGQNDIYHVPSRKLYDIVTSINRTSENTNNSTNQDYYIIIKTMTNNDI